MVDGVDPCLVDLALAVERLRLPVDTEVLAGVLSITDRLVAKTSTLIGEVTGAGLFEDDGAVSMTGWLKDRGAMAPKRATAASKTARRLAGCPVTSAAWLCGALTGGQVDAIVANLSDRVAPLWAEGEANLVPALAGLSPADTAGVMRTWRAKADAVIDDDDGPAPKANSLHLSGLLDGRGAGSLDLDADHLAVLRAALAEAMPAHNRDEPMALSERQAEGLDAICRFYLGDHEPKARKNRPHLNLMITLEDLLAGHGGLDVETGDPITAEMIAAAACEAEIHKVILSTHGAVLYYGRATRTIPADLRTAIAVRDRGCRWPGCDRPPTATEIHHIIAWEHGGTTDYDNLVMLCSKHHHLLHRDHWDFVLDVDTNTVAVNRPGEPPRYGQPRPKPGPGTTPTG